MAEDMIASFKRVEAKYFLTAAQRAALTPVLLEHMAVDQYGEHTISNIFYDTDTFEVTRRSIEKPPYKEKLRVRSYGPVTAETDQVFIELKKKFDGVVYKRRIRLPLAEAQAFLRRGVIPTDTDPQITREIAHFMALYHPKPQVFLCYDRIALAGREDPELRVTLDEHLRWRETELDLRAGAWGQRLLPEGQTLMEIKIPGAMPLWLAHTLSEMQIYRVSFSKIGACFKQFILPEKFVKKAVSDYV